ncbi:MAG: 2-oxoacid:ferredoxin oxidoreductase subunit beta [Candidatus Cloacimonetes bacterium]|nr:2-oxoacid:ferredoxin oxidoreductase subunit beta [Candidatus Cloacimonadota bacterium]
MSEYTMKSYKSETKVTWCPGCGDFGILNALYQAFAEMGWDPNNTVVVSGIGCSSRAPYFFDTYGMHTLHGRALPIATGLKLARQDLNVVVLGGDGDAYSIGGGHFLHACRKNINLTYIVMDNNIYGLTKGQASPTSDTGFETNTTPYGTVEKPLNPVGMALSVGASFVGRTFAGKIKEMKPMFVEAFKHKGFSYIDVLSPCVTFNKENTFKFYKSVSEPIGEDHDCKDYMKALVAAHEPDCMKLGVFLNQDLPVTDEGIAGQTKSLAMVGNDAEITKSIIESYS